METSPMPAPAPDASAPVSRSALLPTFNTLFKRAFHIWKTQWWKIAVLSVVPVLLPVAYALSSPFLTGPGAIAIAIALAVFLVMLNARLAVAQIRLAFGADARIGIGEAWGASKGLAWPAILIGLLSSLAVIGGWVLLVVPGIIWGVSFAFAPFVLVKDGLRGREALVRSRQIVKGNFWWVFWRSLVFTLALILLSLPLAFFVRNEAVRVVNQVISAILFLPLSIGFVVAMFEALSAQKAGQFEPMPRAKTVYAVAAAIGALSILAFTAAFVGLAIFFKGPSGAAGTTAVLPSVPEAAATPEQDAATSAEVAAPYIDTDQDGISDSHEATFGTDPNSADTDGDGLSDLDERFWLFTSPTTSDTDGDGHADSAELLSGYSPTMADTAASQQERDTLVFLIESELHEPTVSTLSAIAEPNPAGFSTEQSRDAKRLADVHNARTVLKLGFDATASYPEAVGAPLGSPAAAMLCKDGDRVALRYKIEDCPELIGRFLGMAYRGFLFPYTSAAGSGTYSIIFTLESDAKDDFSQAPPGGFSPGTYCANPDGIVAGPDC